MAANRLLGSILSDIPNKQRHDLLSFLALSVRDRDSGASTRRTELDELLVTLSLTQALSGRQN